MRGLLIPVDASIWAVALPTVSEVLAGPSVTPLPTAPPSVLGVCNRRGEIVPVFSLSCLLGQPGPSPAERQAVWAVIVDTAAGPGAFPVTATPTAAELGDAVGPAEVACGVSTHRVGATAVQLIDVAALMTPERIAGQL